MAQQPEGSPVSGKVADDETFANTEVGGTSEPVESDATHAQSEQPVVQQSEELPFEDQLQAVEETDYPLPTAAREQAPDVNVIDPADVTE